MGKLIAKKTNHYPVLGTILAGSGYKKNGWISGTSLVTTHFKSVIVR